MWSIFGNLDQNTNIFDWFIPQQNNNKSECFFIKNALEENNTSQIQYLEEQTKRLLKFNKISTLNQKQQISKTKSTNFRKKENQIQHSPIKVLDAPGLIDDFYLNLLSWGNNNQIAIALQNTVYQYNFVNNKIQQGITVQNNLNQYQINEEETDNYICSVMYNDIADRLAITDAAGKLYITDSQTNQAILNQQISSQRIGSIGWQNNLLALGSKDKLIRLYDIRENHFRSVNQFYGHQQEICGLKISPDNNFIASGGNDNQLLIWDLRQMQLFNWLGEHNAAVKALAWNPTQRNIIASGSGTSDRNIRVFDINNSQEMIKIDTGSQVCNLTFDQQGKQLLSTHGFSLNQLITWNYNKSQNKLEKQDLFVAHKLRVLYLGQSACGNFVATAAGDETLWIWKVFQGQSGPKKDSILNPSFLGIR